MRRRLSVALINLVTVGTLTACRSLHVGDNDAGLELRYHLIDLEDPRFGSPTNLYSVAVEILNRGNRTVILPTNAIGPSQDWTGNTGFIRLCDLQCVTADGFPQAQPMSGLALVELRPGEAVSFTGGSIPKTSVLGSVEYTISPSFAKRYGTWSGHLKATTPFRPRAEPASGDHAAPRTGP